MDCSIERASLSLWWLRILKRCWKKREQVAVYHGEGHIPAAEAKQLAHASFQFEDYAVLKEFAGSHPAVMAIVS